MSIKRKILIFIPISVFLLLIILLFANEYIINNFAREIVKKKLGPNVKISKVKLCPNVLCAENLKITTSEGKDFLDIPKISLKPYFLNLLSGDFKIKEIFIENPTLTLKRDKNKKWHIAILKKGEEQAQSSIPIEFLRVNKGEILIIDELKGITTKLKDLDIELNNKINNQDISIKAFTNIDKGGSIELNTKGGYLPEDLNGTLKVKELPIKTIIPYLKTNVKISRGIINFNSNFIIKKGQINAPSNLNAKNVEIEPKGFFMGIASSVLIKMLQKNNEVTINFNIWGTWENLQSDFEKALKRKIAEETEKTISSPIKSIVEPFKGIIKK